MDKFKKFIERKIKQLFIKNEMNILSFKIENECFMDGSKNKEQWKDLVKTLAADGLITLSNEHEVAAYMLNYISSHQEVIKKEINCLSIVYMFEEVSKRQLWYNCSQDTAIIYVCLSLLSQLSKNMFEIVEADKKVLPLIKID